MPDRSATTSLTTPGSGQDTWRFTANGDGSYRIANTATGRLLGVDPSSPGNRAWGTGPTVTAAGTNGPTVGQQWFVIPGASSNGAETGTHRLVNRYSGLVIGMSAHSGRLAETTPARSWSDTTGGSVGGSRTAAEQTLKPPPVDAPGSLEGTHTLVTSGKALDVPDHSKAPGTPLITHGPHTGDNQKWTSTRQSDGSYELRDVESGLCADVSGGATTAGAKLVQWTCTGAGNQRWNLARQTDGTYTVASVKSGLLLTTASASDGAAVTQQAGREIGPPALDARLTERRPSRTGHGTCTAVGHPGCPTVCCRRFRDGHDGVLRQLRAPAARAAGPACAVPERGR